MDWLKDRPTVVAVATSVLLLLAIAELPDGYYQFLQIAVFAASIYLGYRCHAENRTGWLLFAAAAVILFNPIFPVEFEREEWLPLDIGFGIGFAAFAGRNQIAKLLNTPPPPVTEPQGRRLPKLLPIVTATVLAAAAIIFAGMESSRLEEGSLPEVGVDMTTIDQMMDSTVNDFTAVDRILDADAPAAVTTPEKYLDPRAPPVDVDPTDFLAPPSSRTAPARDPLATWLDEEQRRRDLAADPPPKDIDNETMAGNDFLEANTLRGASPAE